MFVDKYKPYYAPDLETGTEQTDQGAPPLDLENQNREVEPVDGPGSGRSKIRKQLETSFDSERKRDAKTGKGYVSRARQEADGTGEETASAEAADGETQEEEGVEGETQQPVTNPPEAWAKEAKAEWAKVPLGAQVAILKREEDISRGVQALQAHYRDIEQVLAPRGELFKQYGKTPAQAVNQLFSWFDSLGGNPDQAFPLLMKSFDYDPRRLIPLINQIMGQQPQQGQEQEGNEIPQPVQQYIGQLEGKIAQLTDAVSRKLGALENNWMQASQAKVQETLDMWSNGKPHFDKVRVMMGHLLESGQVPPLPNGGADLDKAYDMALWAMPDVRQQIMTEMETKKAAELKAKQEAERKAQKEQADKARRAGGSLVPSAPGAPPVPGARKGARKSVGESLREAIAEVRG